MNERTPGKRMPVLLNDDDASLQGALHPALHAPDAPMTSGNVFAERRRQRTAERVQHGNGRPLERYRWWQGLFGRVLYYLELPDTDGPRHVYAVDVWRFSEQVEAHLYLDGRHHVSSKTPAAFPVEGGVIEVAMSDWVVLKRCHYVADNGTERQLTPEPKSAAGRRARFDREHPWLAGAIGFASVVVLLIGLGLNVLQALEPISQIPPIADNFGTFGSPIHLPLWLNFTLVLVAGLAGRERALRLRHNWLLG